MRLLKVVAVPFKVTNRAVRLVGYRRVGLLMVGAAAGAVLSPVSGTELRRRIAEEIHRRRAGTEPTVEERVRQHLAQSPRTWHLPQPEVVAVAVGDGTGWQIILAGEISDASARRDLEQASLSVTGVESVDNRLRVVGQPDA